MAAWPAIRAAVPHATLDVVGDGPLAHLVHGDGVRALGRVRPDEIGGLYAGAAAVVVPSRRDSFSLACLEAMATARPVVCTPVGNMAARVRDGVDGLVVSPDDPPRWPPRPRGCSPTPSARRRWGSRRAAGPRPATHGT